ncbi:MAG: HD domain-containing protein [Lachnospiraceae bacterium]|nr:HD domain-containing protein [Lachnospiraceae bacterium]
MFAFIQAHQLNIMLSLSSICFVVGFFTLITKSLPRRRKLSIAYMEFAAAILLFSDRLAYIYQGQTSATGYYMVRLSNFLVFFQTISVIHAFNIYLTDLCQNEIKAGKVPMRLRFVEILSIIGWVLVVISQFVGLYYTFDENNVYHRGPGFLICYMIPVVALLFQLSVVIQYMKRLSLYISVPVILFTILPLVASIVQALFYGVSLTNMAIVGMAIVLYIFAIIEQNEKYAQAQKQQIDDIKSVNQSVIKSFEQTVGAVTKAMDNRNKYTRGHSQRVAEYSRQIAAELGMDERSCFEVYQSALLHDIARIQMPDSILYKTGHLTEAETEAIKRLPLVGGNILSEIEELPFLQTAARYHHERFDGKGFPEGLKGDAIPLIARIVTVTNAYDEMTSFKANRQPLAQGKVRETFVSGSGRIFDPKIAGIMIEMIDRDTEYMMREAEDQNIEETDKNDITVVSRMHFDNYKESSSDGIRVSREYLKIRFETRPDTGVERKMATPSIVLFDSFDRCIHRNERNIKNLHYFEFGEIWMDGHTICTSARDIQSSIREIEPMDNLSENDWIAYEIEAICLKDHVRVKIASRYREVDVTVALLDSTRFVFLSLTGENCTVKNIDVRHVPMADNEEPISRIAPEVNYFSRKDGDIPNVEVNDYREESTVGIPVDDGMRINFHTQSLPLANLVHHCAYILLFDSEDGSVTGKDYKEYACIRLDGDNATNNGMADNKLIVHKDEDFSGWDAWKELNKNGMDYEVEFKRKKNRIRFTTDNGGISIDCVTTIPKGENSCYVALTGNLCTLSDIRVR